MNAIIWPAQSLTAESATTIVPPNNLVLLVPRFLRWFQFIRERAQNTIESYAYDLQSFTDFCARIGIESPERVTLQLIEAYLGWLRHERHLSAPTAERHRACLRSFFTYLKREGFVPSNPVADTLAMKKPKRLPRYLTISEQEHALACLAENPSPMGKRDRAIVATGLFAGLRCEELARLRLADLDLKTGLLRVIQSKGAKDRELPIVPRLRRIVAEYLEVRCQLVGHPLGELWRRTPTSPWRIRYPENGGYITINTHTYSQVKARQLLYQVAPRSLDSPWVFVNAAPRHSYQLKRAGQPLLTRSIFRIVREKVSPLVGRKVSPHTLRHSFASRLHHNGADPILIQNALGHAHLGTTTIYVHLTTAKIAADITRFLEGESDSRNRE